MPSGESSYGLQTGYGKKKPPEGGLSICRYRAGLTAHPRQRQSPQFHRFQRGRDFFLRMATEDDSRRRRAATRKGWPNRKNPIRDVSSRQFMNEPARAESASSRARANPKIHPATLVSMRLWPHKHPHGGVFGFWIGFVFAPHASVGCDALRAKNRVKQGVTQGNQLVIRYAFRQHIALQRVERLPSWIQFLTKIDGNPCVATVSTVQRIPDERHGPLPPVLICWS